MLSKVYSYGICGLEAYPVTIEVDISNGLPSTTVVGLPDNAVKESRERVRSAIKNSGFKYPSSKITVNLSPADIKKEGPSFDLPIALGILAASGQLAGETLKTRIILGELSLDGNVQSIRGVLPIAMHIPRHRFKNIILPMANAQEAGITRKITPYPVKNLQDTVKLFTGEAPQTISKTNTRKKIQDTTAYDIDFADVKGQFAVKRGLEVAAAGGHNVLMIGPPGSGKTMLAKRLATILPDLTFEESLETTKIHSVMGLINLKTGLITKRPFRSPHHTASDVALVGGGSIPKPGEVTLSHNGILFLDELPEFRRNVLESLRQPLEDKVVTVSRASRSIRFPANFMLIASMNPCPCGWLMDPTKECHCTQHQIQKYISKISGPLLDRIDIYLEVPCLKVNDIFTSHPAEPSRLIKERTVKARDIQLKRFGDTKIFSNAQMNSKHFKQYCNIDNDGRKLLKRAIEELGLSARAHDKIIKVARTIADLESSELVLSHHMAEAIQYRSLERNWLNF